MSTNAYWGIWFEIIAIVAGAAAIAGIIIIGVTVVAAFMERMI